MNKIYIAVFLAVLLAGCTSMDKYYSQEALEISRNSGINLTENWCDPTDQNCVCMICENSDWFEFFNPYNLFYSLDLREGTCRFQPGCTEDLFKETSELGISEMLFGQEQVRFFMLGQGTNFAEFADANRYCNNSLRLAVKWVTTTQGFDYPIPSSERAECLLEKDVMPMYLLYTENGSIDVESAGEFAETFNEVGPVIISAEFDVDPTNRTALDLAVDQAILMKSKCPNCLIAFSPKFQYDSREFGDLDQKVGFNYTYEALDYVFTESPKRSEAASSIDLIGVGLNSHYSQDCSASKFVYDAKEYSKYALRKYNKPSIWPYILMDDGQANAPLGEEGSCIWTNDEIVKTYDELYKGISTFVSLGVIGYAPYSLYGLDSGPLECENCGLMNIDGVTYSQHQKFFSQCQVYYVGNGIVPIVFSPVECADCSFANNYNRFQLEQFSSGKVTAPEDLEAVLPTDIFYTCNGQMLSEVPEEIQLGSYTYNIGDEAKQCTWYPELDIFSDLRDADPVLTRAITWMETGFSSDVEGPGGDMCDVSRVEASRCSQTSLGQPECLQTVVDPEGKCGTQSGTSAQPYIHSMGLMQTHTYPQDQWEFLPEGSDVQYEDEALWCGGSDGFNPFNKADNACLGTAVILDKLQYGRNIVSNKESLLGLSALKNEYGEKSSEYLNMKNAYVIFFSSYYYSGFTTMYTGSGANRKLDTWLYEFSAQKEVTDEYCEVMSSTSFECCSGGEALTNSCCNQKNAINYLQFCKFPSLGASEVKAKYGLKVLGFYKSLMECEKYDEGAHEQNLINYLQSYGDEIPEEDEDEP